MPLIPEIGTNHGGYPHAVHETSAACHPHDGLGGSREILPIENDFFRFYRLRG